MEMERLRLFSLKFFVVLALTSFQLVHAQEQTGFLSIDCGVDEDYLDETTGFQYVSDKNFVSTGENANVLPEYISVNDNVDKLYRSLRYFPEGKKNCYHLKPDQGKNNNYLIRAFFSYGNYDRKNQPPKFDLYLGLYYWLTVEFLSNDGFFFTTIYHFSLSDIMFVCLVNTGAGLPLISALELRPLNNSIYRTDSGFAFLFPTYDAGFPNGTITRYKDDIYDREWWGFMRDDWIVVNTSENLDIRSTADSFKVPSEVLRTAVQPSDNLTSLVFRKVYDSSASSYNVYFYFAEVQRIPQGRKREFTITLNDVLYGPYSPPYLETVPCERVRLLDGFIQFSIDSTVQSDFPPILNGFEIIADYIENYSASATSSQDVVAITEIKRIYKIDRPHWQGDPCMPRDFSWTGLNCTTYNNTPRITSVDLSSSALSGPVASEFSNLLALRSLDLSNNKLTGYVPEFLPGLTNLVTLDLSNNNLTGVVPEFLAELPNLVTLDISGNQLTGPLPQSLVEKSRNGTLKLSFSLNPSPPIFR